MTPRVSRAIERSVSHNEIVTIDACPADLDALRVECEDRVKIHGDEGIDLVQYWGKTGDGDEWRVHARPDGNVTDAGIM